MADKSVAVLFSQEELLLIEEALSSLDREVDRPGVYDLHARIVKLLDEMEEGETDVQ